MSAMGLHNQKASNVWEDTWLMRLFLFYVAFMSKETPTVNYILVFIFFNSPFTFFSFKVIATLVHSNFFFFFCNAAPKPHRPVRVLQAPQKLP